MMETTRVLEADRDINDLRLDIPGDRPIRTSVGAMVLTGVFLVLGLLPVIGAGFILLSRYLVPR